MDRSGEVRRRRAVGLVREEATSTWADVPGAWGPGTRPAKGVRRWGLSAGKSSPTPRSPRTTLLNILA